MRTPPNLYRTLSALQRLGLACAAGVALLIGTGTALAAPANDDFANAIDLPGNSGTQTGTDNIDATLEGGEPGPGATNTVWFKWTCPADGDFTYGTSGSTNGAAGEWDAIIGIYTGGGGKRSQPAWYNTERYRSGGIHDHSGDRRHHLFHSVGWIWG